PADLAEVGFDEFYLLRGRADVHLFRPSPAAAGAFFGLDVERVYGRTRLDLSTMVEITRPALRAGVEIPAVASDDWEGTGSFSAAAGATSLGFHPVSGPDSVTRLDLGFARGELGFE